MRKNLITSILMTMVTTILLGLVYPLVVTAAAQLLFPSKANGQLIRQNGAIIGSRIIGQPFTGPEYFDSRPSAAGSGYDATASGASNFGPTNRQLIERVDDATKALHEENPTGPVPIDLVTTSGSGLDPDITPAAALFQVPIVAKQRHISESDLRALVERHIKGRTFGVLGEPRVNVLELNLALDHRFPMNQSLEHSTEHAQ